MTMDFFLGQLRLALVAALAYCGGKGWLTPTDSGLAMALITSLGPIIGPWIWSVYVNINGKIVPSHAMVIDPIVTTANAGNPTVTVSGLGGSSTTGKVVGALLAALFLGALITGSSPAMAQLKTPGQIQKDITAALQRGLGQGSATATSPATSALDSAVAALAKPFQDIANFIGEDADQAVSLSTVIPEIQDGHGQQCWMAMSSFGKIIKAHPVPLTLHVMDDFETLRLLAIATNRLCTNVHCTQVFADGSSMAQAASPMPLLIPTLHDLCTKVPQIALVDPVPADATAPAAK